MPNKILIYNSGGGLGDSIHLFPLILSLKNHFKSSDFYYLSSHENHFVDKLKDYGVEVKNLNLNIKYFGFRWWHFFLTNKRFKKLNLEKFDLVVDLQSKLRNTIILKQIPSKNFYSPTFNHFFCTNKNYVNKLKNKKTSFNNIKSIIFNLKIYLNINFKDIEYSIKDIAQDFHNEALRLLPKNNYVGFSITQGNIYRKKEWPLKNVIEMCKKLKLNNKTPVFFIEKKNTILKDQIIKLIPDSLFPEHESNISSPALVTCLGKRLDFAISIDNGIMHMLSLSKVPMVILFGPTKSEKFAPKYENIIVLDSKKLKNTSDISTINVEDVLQVLKLTPNFLY